MKWGKSDRLNRLPPYLFAELEKKQKALRAQGKEIINLGIGDPDQPAPTVVVNSLIDTLYEEGIHEYSTTLGEDEFRIGVAKWMKRKYGVDLNPDKEVLLGVGSKELIAHTPTALTNPGDVVLLPDPGYPPYRSGTIFALAEPYTFKLKKENKFIPDLDSIPKDIAERAKIIYVNYPNNPTGATATRDFYKKLVDFAHRHGILVVSDAAYIELYYEDLQPSFLSVPGAKEVGIEIHSMTKTFNMAGWRIAWACGNAEAIEVLRSFKANCDSGQFKALQRATARVLVSADKEMKDIRNMYKQRRDVLVSGLKELKWNVEYPKATFYVWFECPKGFTSMQYTDHLLEKAGVVVTPGSGFGSCGEGFSRIALTTTVEQLRLAVEKLKKV